MSSPLYPYLRFIGACGYLDTGLFERRSGEAMRGWG
jgi:hypothetical protein